MYSPCAFIRKRLYIRRLFNQLITQICDFGQENKDLSCIRFFQQRGILHQNRNCEKCGKEMRIATDRGIYKWRV